MEKTNKSPTTAEQEQQTEQTIFMMETGKE
jgi:hypothetical protein